MKTKLINILLGRGNLETKEIRFVRRSRVGANPKYNSRLYSGVSRNHGCLISHGSHKILFALILIGSNLASPIYAQTPSIKPAPNAGVNSAVKSASIVASAASKSLTGNAKIYQELMTQYGEAFVRVKYVMSMSFGGNDNRQEVETSAVLVGDDGLILVSASMINPKSMMAAAMPPGMDFPDMKADEFRVRLADSDEDLDAVLITQDSDLGLAWLKLKVPPKKIKHVDLSKIGTLEIGQPYYSLSRTSADFGNVVVGSHGTVVGKTDTPIKSLLVNGPLDLAFAPDGKIVGFVTLRIGKDFMMNSRLGGSTPQSMVYADKLQNVTELARKVQTK